MTVPRVAVTAVFAGNGVLMGSYLARLPEVQERIGLSEGELGLALFGGPVGLVGAALLAGGAVVRFGSRAVSAAGAAGYAGLLWLLALAPSLPALFGAMIVFGASSGVLDVAMNTQGVTVERRHPRRIFASLHAGFSFGALAGAAVAGLAAELEVPFVWNLVGIGVVVGVVFAAAIRVFVPDPPDARSGPKIARPTGALLAVGAVALCVLLAEGALNDWSAVYLDEVQGAGAATAAAGLVVFSLAMGTGRLLGDPLAERLGARLLAQGGLALAAAAFVLAGLAPAVPVTLVAFLATGFGLAAVFPLCLRAAARDPDTPDAAGIAAVTTTGYLGFLAGPPLVGLLASIASLRVSLLALAVLCGGAAVLASALRE